MATPIVTSFTHGDCQTLATRLILQLGNVSFTDRLITKEEWNNEFQGKVTGGHMPFVEYDGNTFSQSLSMQYLAAERAGLVPKDNGSRARAMMIATTIDDGRVHCGIYEGNESMEEYDRNVLINGAAGKLFAKQLENVEKMLESFGAQATSWALGDSLSYADAIIAAAYKVAVKSDAEVAKKCPIATRIAKLVLSHPATIDIARLKSSKVATTYFGGMEGRVHCIRQMLRILGVEFEDRRLSFAEAKTFNNEKSLSGRVPTFEVDDIMFTDTRAIMQMLARLANMQLTTPEEEAHALQIVSACDEYELVMFHTWKEGGASDEQQRELDSVLKHHVPPVLATLDRLVGLQQDVEGHAIANKFTWVDLMIYGMYTWLSSRFMNTVIEDLERRVPNILKVVQCVSHVPVCLDVERTWEGDAHKFYYFDIHGLGEACRLMFELASVPVEDVRFSKDEWVKTYKPKSPTGKCPYLEIGDTVICEQVAILRYAAEYGAFMPFRFKARAQANSYHSHWYSNVETLRRLAPYDMENRAAKQREVGEEQMIPALQAFVSYVQKTQSTEGYLVENRLTWVDVYIAAQAQNLVRDGWLTIEQLKSVEPVYRTMKQIYGLKELKAFLVAEEKRDTERAASK